MSKAVTPQRWFAGWRASRPPAQSDPADYGTAFGLELSLDDSAVDLPPPPADRRPAWVRRLALRRRSAT